MHTLRCLAKRANLLAKHATRRPLERSVSRNSADELLSILRCANVTAIERACAGHDEIEKKRVNLWTGLYLFMPSAPSRGGCEDF